MPRVEIGICRGPECSKNQGAVSMVPDIEELFNVCPDVEVNSMGCVNKCKEGPNVRIGQNVTSGVSGWRQIQMLIPKANAQSLIDNTRKKVGELRYQARREKSNVTRKATLDKAFAAIGGEAKGEQSYPELLGELLTFRANMSLEANKAPDALKDALKATELLPGWGSAFLALAGAHVAMSQMEEASKAIAVANQYRGYLDNKELGRVEDKVQEWADKKKEEQEAEEAKKRQVEEVAKAKAEAEAKAKAKAKAQARAKALALKKKKEEQAAKAKAEEEAKAKAEEEARLAEEERLRLEEEARLAEEERLREEEAKRKEEEERERLRKEEEERERLRKEEEERLRLEAEAEAKRLEEERRRKEAAQRAWEEAEAKRIAEEATLAGMFKKFCCRPSPSKTADVCGDEKPIVSNEA